MCLFLQRIIHEITIYILILSSTNSSWTSYYLKYFFCLFWNIKEYKLINVCHISTYYLVKVIYNSYIWYNIIFYIVFYLLFHSIKFFLFFVYIFLYFWFHFFKRYFLWLLRIKLFVIFLYNLFILVIFFYNIQYLIILCYKLLCF